MNLFGLGSEIVECARVARLIERHGEDFLRRVFTDREVVICSRRSLATQHYAARWACKQAVLKAFSYPSHAGFYWQDIEVRGGLRSGLRVALGGPLRELCTNHRVAKIAVSASFVRSLAIAHAVVFTLDDH